MVYPKEGYSWIRNNYLRDPEVTPTEKVVFLIIAGHANSDSDISSISMDQIGRETGITTKTILKMLKQMQSLVGQLYRDSEVVSFVQTQGPADRTEHGVDAILFCGSKCNLTVG